MNKAEKFLINRELLSIYDSLDQSAESREARTKVGKLIEVVNKQL